MAPIENTDAQAFKRVVHARYSAKSFTAEPIPEDVLRDILRESQRAPSSLNSQPYKAIVIRDEEQRKALAKIMPGFNQRIIESAPVSIAFLADFQPTKNIHRVQELMTDALVDGGTEGQKQFIAFLPPALRYFARDTSVEGIPDAGIEFEDGPPAPSVEAWAFRDTAMVAQTFMLAAAANGLGSVPLEGYDPAKVRRVLNIPERYGIPMIVSAGYADDEALSRSKNPSARLPATEIYDLDSFGASSSDLFITPP